MGANPVASLSVSFEAFFNLNSASGRAYRGGLSHGRAPMDTIGAIRACGHSEKVPADRENEVGLLVAEQLGKLLDAIGWDWAPMRSVIRGGERFFEDAPEDMGGRDGDAARLLAEVASPRERNGRLLAADALCELFDGLGATEHAEGWRKGTAEAWHTWSNSDKGHEAQRELWSSWLSPVSNEQPVAVYAYSAPVGEEKRTFYATPERAPKVHQAIAEAVILRWVDTRTGFVPATVATASGARYAGMNKLGVSTAWAIGTQGEATVIVDGVTFAGSPVTRYAPRIAGVTKGGLPAARTLGLEVETDPSGLLAIAFDSQAILSPLAGKLVTLLLSLPDRRSGSLIELARVLYPSGRVQKRDLEMVAEALRQLAALKVVFHDDTVSQVFDIRLPRGEANAEQTIATALGVGLVAELDREANAWLKGEALINLDGMMAMAANRALQRRLYLLAAGDWNDAMMPGGTHKARTLDEWTARTNQRSRDAKSKAVSVAGDEVIEAARQLAKSDLARIEEGGVRGRRLLTIKPTDEHLEAYRLSRKNGRR